MRVVHERTWGGRLFQTVGAAVRKAREPNDKLDRAKDKTLFVLYAFSLRSINQLYSSKIRWQSLKKHKIKKNKRADKQQQNTN